MKILALACLVLFLLAGVYLATRAQANDRSRNADWPVYGGKLGDEFSPLKQIDTTNVKNLHEAWRYDSGEDGGIETTPIVVGNALYGYTPTLKIIKLDATTGKLIWKFDPGVTTSQPSRAITFWSEGKQSLIFAGVMNFLYCLDPATGKPVAGFGDAGRIDLRKDLRGDYRVQSYALTSPGVVYKDVIVVGGRVPEDYPAPPGDIRAYDIQTGALRWTFHTIPHPGEPGYETWPKDAWTYAGSANNWAGMTVDDARGIVYIPTGSAVADFYGGDRTGDNLYANTLLALDAQTGKLLWHFQAVHHDIWDRDLPSPPTLVTVLHDGTLVDAVAQTTKHGDIFIFDRVTGKPLFPIEERKVPASDVPGEVASATQPRPTLPEPFARQVLTAADLTTRTPEAHAWAVEQFNKYRSAGQFVPLRLGKLDLLAPGFDGGGMWGGSAFDPVSQVLYVNGNNTAWIAGIVQPPPPNTAGEGLYQQRCSMCHGIDRAGQPPAFPSLLGVHDRLSDQAIAQVIRSGKGRMPAFSDFTGGQLNDLIRYVTSVPMVDRTAPSTREMQATAGKPTDSVRVSHGVPYKFTGYKKFLDPDGYPAVSTPWGTLNAIDLKTGKYLWKIPFGQYPELTAKGVPITGSENYGGPVITAGGVLFIGATEHDPKLHAYEASSGKLLWEGVLPFSAVSTPATYMEGGRQFVVVGAGGGKDTPEHRGGVYVAFTLK